SLEGIDTAAVGEHKPFQITVTIEDDLHDAARVFDDVFAGLRSSNRRAIRRGWDRIRITAQSFNAIGNEADVSFEDWIPAVPGRHLLEPPFHNRQRIFLRKQHDLSSCYRNFDLECTDHLAPAAQLRRDVF